MLQHQRERMLYRILSGKTKIKSLGLVVNSPSLDLLYEAEEIYCEYYEKRNVLTKEEIHNMLLKNKIILQSDIDFLKDYEKLIKNLQKELCANFNTVNADGVRSLIKQARDHRDTIIEKMAKYETYSKESMSHYCKSIFLIKNTTFLNNQLYNFDNKPPISILSELNKDIITNSDIREVARKSSWTNIWYGTKGGFINSVPTTEQQLLLIWSKIYDNIRESQDCPTDDMIEDDDAIDGWLILREEESLKKKSDNTNKLRSNSKIANADEVFIIAKNKDDVDRIQRMNSQQARRIQKERMSQIYDKKAVDHHNLLDVRREVQTKFHNMQLEHIKKTK